MANESTIRAILAASGAVVAVVPAARIWDEAIPASVQSPVPLPYVIMNTVSELPENTLADGVSVGDFRIQFDVFGDSKSQVRSVLDAIRVALDSEGTEVFARAVPSGDPGTRRITSDWRFWLPR